MECERIRERFSSFLEGESDPSEEREIRDHISSCLPCSRDLEQLRKTLHWLHDLDEVDVPGDFLPETRKKMEIRKQVPHPGAKWYVLPTSFKLSLQAAAMVAVVFLAVYVTRMTQQKEIPPGRDLPRESRVPSGETRAWVPPKTEEGKDVLVQRAPEPAVKTPIGRHETKERSPTENPVLEDLDKEVKPARKLLKKQEEITLTFAGRDRAVSLLDQLARRFNGEIVAEEGDVLLVSLPETGFEGFMAGLKEGASRFRKDEIWSEGKVAGGLSASPGASPGPGGKLVREKVEGMGEPAPGKGDRLVIRIRLVHE